VIEAHQAGKLQEVFGTGTAAVVAHVSEIQYRDTNLQLPPMENRKIGTMIKAEIDGLRAGTVEDTRGWVIPVKSMIEV
jgi:branched-chain amino acid aminotransferase